MSRARMTILIDLVQGLSPKVVKFCADHNSESLQDILMILPQYAEDIE